MDRATGITNVDISIIRKSIATIILVFPKTKSIGSIFNPTEQNSVFVQKLIQEVCNEKQITLVQRTCSSPTQFQSIIENLSSEIDALYCANDNLVNRAVTNISRTSSSLKIPFFIGELSAVPTGPFAGIGVEYSQVGKRLAEMAKIILERKQFEPYPPLEGPSKVAFWLNIATAREVGFNIDSISVIKADSLIQ